MDKIQKIYLFFSLLEFFAVVQSDSEGASCPVYGGDVQTDKDFPEVVTGTWQECASRCREIPECTHWAWRDDSWPECPDNHGVKNGCYRKISSTGEIIQKSCQTDGLVTGTRECGLSTTTTRTPTTTTTTSTTTP